MILKQSIYWYLGKNTKLPNNKLKLSLTLLLPDMRICINFSTVYNDTLVTYKNLKRLYKYYSTIDAIVEYLRRWWCFSIPRWLAVVKHELLVLLVCHVRNVDFIELYFFAFQHRCYKFLFPSNLKIEIQIVTINTLITNKIGLNFCVKPSGMLTRPEGPRPIPSRPRPGPSRPRPRSRPSRPSMDPRGRDFFVLTSYCFDSHMLRWAT